MNSEGNTREAAPKARFCSCQYETIKPGAYVYLKRKVEGEPAMLTVNFDEADARNTQAVGAIVGAAFQLNERGEQLLQALE